MTTDAVQVAVRHGEHEWRGEVGAGESWRAAALRIGAEARGEPEPVDLSGAVKSFTVDPDIWVALREMTHADLDTVMTWRSNPALAQWWIEGEASDPERVRARYAERIDGLSPTRMWVVEINGRSVGFVQDYRIGDHPEYAVLGPDPEAIGVDYAVGADEWRGRGLGPRLLWAWMGRARDHYRDATTYFAAPDHRNAASRRILLKAGFVEGLWFDEPEGDGTHTVVGHTLDVPTVIG